MEIGNVLILSYSHVAFEISVSVSVGYCKQTPQTGYTVAGAFMASGVDFNSGPPG